MQTLFIEIADNPKKTSVKLYITDCLHDVKGLDPITILYTLCKILNRIIFIVAVNMRG